MSAECVRVAITGLMTDAPLERMARLGGERLREDCRRLAKTAGARFDSERFDTLKREARPCP